MSEDGRERLYGWCHDCGRQIGVASDRDDARLKDLAHQDSERTHVTSWSNTLPEEDGLCSTDTNQ